MVVVVFKVEQWRTLFILIVVVSEYFREIEGLDIVPFLKLLPIC